MVSKGKVYVPIKKPPVIFRNAKATPESVFAECKAFAKNLKKIKQSLSSLINQLDYT